MHTIPKNPVNGYSNHHHPHKDHHDNHSPTSTTATNGTSALQAQIANEREQNPSNHKHKHKNKQKQKQKHSSLAAKRQHLLEARRNLPIWQSASAIRESLRKRDVLVLVGETGCGKSTQVPQFLVDERWCTGCIAVTQPRRVAAVSLAKRVAEEMGCSLASSTSTATAMTMASPVPDGTVGYAVRFDSSTSANTRIKYVTEGLLLQEMLRDRTLGSYSAIVVDEVHERSVNVDVLLALLVQLVSARNNNRGMDGECLQNGQEQQPLKLVVMSATAEAERLAAYLEHGLSSAPSTLSQGMDVESEASWSGISNSDEEDEDHSDDSDKSHKGILSNGTGHQLSILNDASEESQYDEKSWKLTNGFRNNAQSDMVSEKVSFIAIKGRQYPVSTMYLAEPTPDCVEASLKSIFTVHTKESLPGDILCFLTGQEMIESLEQLVNQYAENMSPDIPKVLVLPLFAALPQTAQQLIFRPAPPGTRKIILATNIAETSVTVPGIRYVIDSGKAKLKSFNSRLGFETLLSKPISKSAAIQRKGRAGREAPGKCYRLYTEVDFVHLQDSTTPEILRCDLATAVLDLKARGVEDVFSFPLLDRPPKECTEEALLQLLQIGALSETGQITERGKKIAKLPLSPFFGRTLTEATLPQYDCLDDLIDIISCLNVENIFLNPTSEEAREEAASARSSLLRRAGDHLTLLSTLQAYQAEQSNRKAWAHHHFISYRAIERVMDVRTQLRRLLDISDAYSSGEGISTALTESRIRAIMHCLIQGFASQTAVLMPDGGYRTSLGKQYVAIHPSSTLFGRKVPAIVFTECVYTNRSYARGVSAVELSWIEDVLVGRDFST